MRDQYEVPTIEDMANALKQFPRYKIDNQPETAPSASNGPKRSRAMVGDTDARLDRD